MKHVVNINSSLHPVLQGHSYPHNAAAMNSQCSRSAELVPLFALARLAEPASGCSGDEHSA